MKKSKIIGALVGAFGVVVSVGTALALYTKAANNLEFTIGSATHTTSTSTVQYQINGSNSPTVNPSYYKHDAVSNSGTAFGGEYVCAKYEYELGASFAEDIQAQDYIVGNLSVSLTSVVASLQNKVQVSMYFEGYGDNTLGKHYYGSNLTTGTDDPETEANEEASINNYVLTGSSLSVNARDICVSSNRAQKLVIYFELLNTVDFLSMNEANNLWTLSVTWDKPSNAFVPAYMVNNATLWEQDDEFVMAPNIGKAYSEGWEWYGQIKGTEKVTAAKCRQGDKWSGGDDTPLANGTVYNATWNGEHGVNASITARS
jgi:hypothetical protein